MHSRSPCVITMEKMIKMPPEAFNLSGRNRYMKHTDKIFLKYYEDLKHSGGTEMEDKND